LRRELGGESSKGISTTKNCLIERERRESKPRGERSYRGRKRRFGENPTGREKMGRDEEQVKIIAKEGSFQRDTGGRRTDRGVSDNLKKHH